MVTRTDDNLRLSRVFRSSCWLSFSTKPGSQTGTGTFEPGRIFAFVRQGVEHANCRALHAMIRASFVSRVGVMGLPFALVQLNKTDKNITVFHVVLAVPRREPLPSLRRILGL